MKLIRGLHNLQACHCGCVLTIGNFDGFHRGHQALITQLQTEGRKFGLPVMVMIFEPQPQEHFAGRDAPTRLTRLRDKIKYLAEAGVDVVLCVTFDVRFAAISAESFVTDLLVRKLGVRFLCVGDDFRFGTQRRGDFAFLQQMGAAAGFDVMSTATYATGGKRISSTAVREALASDQLVVAEMLLGHPYRISGRVEHGDELGRTLGFPTANVSLKGRPAPINGVYAVEVNGLGPQPIEGVANIGTRPTVAGLRQRVEVHLLDVAMDIYGCHIEVVVRAKLRNEQRFASLDELKRQITNDAVAGREFFRLAAPL
ncbi:bifunctional riboflavin kinase/FAD synthetase [Acerihabitans sp. TG2]|uniref:bifunctional riboflavin kinase/FAD synthetase n=1 Tax=Acerihabitans sp. TG2 TaxID=3096008 RepID=UPI002B230C08|nr:bifunctional riboflavin kinase/FAD synthetase [Acerihabitans sp. TG2]MEA9392808.1 bifunctional riboflavin kinase/FAD synthetase [Acerihabitans sp. TG2]